MLPTDKELLSNLSENRHRSAKKKKKKKVARQKRHAMPL